MGKYKSEICGGCHKSLESGSLLKHISHKGDCKIVYGDRYIDMLNENRKATQRQNHLKNKNERNERRRKSNKEKSSDPSDIKNAASPKLLETSKEKKSCLVIPIKYDATCKECGKSIKQRHFFNHVSNSKKCKEAYGEDFIKEHKKSNQRCHMKNYTNRQNNKLIWDYQDNSDSDVEGLVLKCNGCKVEFTSERFFRHVSHAKKCKAAYTDDEWNDMMKDNRKFLNWRNHFDHKKERKVKMKSYYEENKKAFKIRKQKRESIEKENDEIRKMQYHFETDKETYMTEPNSIFERELSPSRSLLQLYNEEIKILVQKCHSEEMKNQLIEQKKYIEKKLKDLKDEYDLLIKEIEEKTGKWDLDDKKIWKYESSVDREFVRHILRNFTSFLKSEHALLTFHTHGLVSEIATKVNVSIKEPGDKFFVKRFLKIAPSIASKQKKNEVKYNEQKENIRKKHQDKELHDKNLLESLEGSNDPIDVFTVS